jgi:hypothetical protein
VRLLKRRRYARFPAAARQSIPRLIDEIRRLPRQADATDPDTIESRPTANPHALTISRVRPASTPVSARIHQQSGISYRADMDGGVTTTCLACREHACREYRAFAEQFE